MQKTKLAILLVDLTDNITAECNKIFVPRQRLAAMATRQHATSILALLHAHAYLLNRCLSGAGGGVRMLGPIL